jgi:hypothetical protein
LQGQAVVAAFFSALSELLKSPSKFLVCVHSEILDLVRDEKLRNDALKREKLKAESGKRKWGEWGKAEKLKADPPSRGFGAARSW